MAKHTMRDVARLAGVSVATVSAVVNGTAKVSEVRSKRVLEAMEAIDYHPDQVARSLRVGKTNVIAMVLPDITNPFFPEVIRGAEDAARGEGYSVMLCDSYEDPEQERRHLNELFSRRLDGVLIACSDASTAYDSLIRRRFPIVFVDRIPNSGKPDGVGTDNMDAGRMATEHLISLGHTRIAFLAGRLSLSPHSGRLEGFRRAMESSGLPVRSEYLLMDDHFPECQGSERQIDSGRAAAKKLLELPVPPTAVVASVNRTLLGFMMGLHELGVPCPAGISVIGFDDYTWTQHFTPKLSVIAQPAREIGRRGMQLLLSKISAGDAEEETLQGEVVLLKAELRARESTAPLPRNV